MRRLPGLLVLAGFARMASAQTPHAPDPESGPQELGVTAEVVSLDLVVRDKKGRPLLDLRREEIEVLEDGVPHEVVSFRKLEPGPASEATETADGMVVYAEPPSASAPKVVSLVFDNLDTEGRRLARSAAQGMLKDGLMGDALVSVISIDNRLFVLQPFTRDAGLIGAAIERATRGTHAVFQSQSEAIQRELAEGGSGGDDGASGRVAGGATMAAEAAEAARRRALLDMMRFSESLQQRQQGRSSLYSLLAVVREQRALSGRKAVLYFSQGLQVPGELEDAFRSAISEANRANVSVYSFDARALTSERMNEAGRQLLQEAVDASYVQMTSRTPRPVSREEANIHELAIAGMRQDVQGTLLALAESTGGFLIANTNDLRPGVRRIVEDMTLRYEIGYVPKAGYDGSFREISVKVRRPDVHVQTRRGYFALPPREGPPILPFELPMLETLDAPAPPHSFDYRAALLRFGPHPEGIHHTLVVEVPLSRFELREQRDQKLYRGHLSVLARLKDAAGTVGEGFSQDYPFEVPAQQVERLREGVFVMKRELHLLAGRYRLETVAIDRLTGQASVQRYSIAVPEQAPGVQVSSVALVRRIEQLVGASEITPPDDPFLSSKSRIVPSLSDVAKRDPERPLLLYFVIHPSKDGPREVGLTLALLKDEELKTRSDTTLEWRKRDADLPYLARLPLSGLEPGRYEVRAIARHGESQDQAIAFVEVQ